jgi:pyruvate dehydrogenase E2 component (dihydrolipoamide acetyltransferase)
MAVAIRMPDMGTNVEECKLLAWRVREGERVKRGEVLAEIETDKAVAELESTAEGVLLRHAVKAGDPARTGDVLAYVGQPGEPLPDQTTTGPETDAAHAGGIAPASAKAERPSALPRPEPGAPTRVSPLVRNLAAKLGVDLAALSGTGTGGVITREDVLLASRAAKAGAKAGEPLSRAQTAVARAVLRSWKEIPHLHISAIVDMTATQKVRAESESNGYRPSYDAIFLKAMARAIQAVPLVAARLEGDRVVRVPGIHIALAIGFENELALPVVRDVDQKDLHSLQREISELAGKVRTGTLKPEQLTGGCMALSNLGMYPVDAFEGIIFPEHSALLTTGRVQKKAVVVGDRVEVRPMARVTLSADHRLINGRTAAEFLAKVKEAVELGDL